MRTKVAISAEARAGRGWLALAALTVMLMSGCAVHYFDRATQTEHLWGFGHLKMRAAPQPVAGTSTTNPAMAVVTGTETLGLNLGFGEDFGGLAAGWDSRSRVVIRAPDACFCLTWPTNSVRWPGASRHLFSIRVGTNLPPCVNPQTPTSP